MNRFEQILFGLFITLLVAMLALFLLSGCAVGLDQSVSVTASDGKRTVGLTYAWRQTKGYAK